MFSSGRVGSVWIVALAACAPQSSGGGLDAADVVSIESIAAASQVVVEAAPPAPASRMDEGEPVVAPPPFSPGIFPCSRCHTAEEPEPLAGPRFPHQRHWDVGMDCDGCHGSPPTRARPETCYQCHLVGSARRSAAVNDYFLAHSDAAGAVTIPHRWETADVDPNHAGHEAVGVTCTQCHGEPPFDRPRPVSLMVTCVSCHKSMAVSVDCRTCHAVIHESQHADVHLDHAEGITSCFACHDVEDRDSLRLATGRIIPFEQSYLLCGQCHGTRLREWREGLHGKRLGRWDGEHEYLLCVHCHRDPHDPGFPPMTPMAPPPRPEDIR